MLFLLLGAYGRSRGSMHAVASKGWRVVKVHPKDETGKILFEDVGMLPPSLTMHLSKLAWIEIIQQLPEERCISPKNVTFLWKGLEMWDALEQELMGTNQWPKCFTASSTT
jgi:hypothetical protein